MNGVDTLALNFGLSQRFRFAQVMVAITGLMGVLWCPASVFWKFSAIFLLMLSAWRIDRLTAHPDRSGMIRLCIDGTARLRTASGYNARVLLKANNWTSRWLCVLALYEVDHNRHHYCVICASDNFNDQYRRLLVLLRMGSPDAGLQKATW